MESTSLDSAFTKPQLSRALAFTENSREKVENSPSSNIPSNGKTFDRNATNRKERSIHAGAECHTTRLGRLFKDVPPAIFWYAPHNAGLSHPL
mmetsp:Transcript_3520/g.5226  ORF Transcript_3520/g.5226 Transcript_3520/m.5226 type:complete len:93 (-) Transcript_3520:222-500(-)